MSEKEKPFNSEEENIEDVETSDIEENESEEKEADIGNFITEEETTEKKETRTVSEYEPLSDEKVQEYYQNNKEVKIGGEIWKIKEILEDDNKVILTRSPNIKEIGDITDKLIEDKENGIASSAGANLISKTSSIGIDVLSKSGEGVVYNAPKSLENPYSQNDIEAIKALREKIAEKDPDEKYLGKITDVLDYKEEKINEDGELYENIKEGNVESPDVEDNESQEKEESEDWFEDKEEQTSKLEKVNPLTEENISDFDEIKLAGHLWDVGSISKEEVTLKREPSINEIDRIISEGGSIDDLYKKELSLNLEQLLEHGQGVNERDLDESDNFFVQKDIKDIIKLQESLEISGLYLEDKSKIRDELERRLNVLKESGVDYEEYDEVSRHADENYELIKEIMGKDEELETEEIINKINLLDSKLLSTQSFYKHIVRNFQSEDIKLKALEGIDPKEGVDIFAEILRGEVSAPLQNLASEKMASVMEQYSEKELEMFSRDFERTKEKRYQEERQEAERYTEDLEALDERGRRSQNISEKRRSRDYWDEWEDWSKQNKVLESTSKPFIETGRKTTVMWEKADAWLDKEDKYWDDYPWYTKAVPQAMYRGAKAALYAGRILPIRALGGLAKLILSLPKLWMGAFKFVWKLTEAVDKGGDMGGIWSDIDKGVKKKTEQYMGLSDEINP